MIGSCKPATIVDERERDVGRLGKTGAARDSVSVETGTEEERLLLAECAGVKPLAPVVIRRAGGGGGTFFTDGPRCGNTGLCLGGETESKTPFPATLPMSRPWLMELAGTGRLGLDIDSNSPRFSSSSSSVPVS